MFTQIFAAFFIVAAIVSFVAAQYVDFENRKFSWVDYVGAVAMTISLCSGILSVISWIWSI